MISRKLKPQTLPHPSVWSKSFLGTTMPEEIHCERMVFGACDWTDKVYLSVSPGKYRVYYSLDQAKVYDGQSYVEAVETQPLCPKDIDWLVKLIGSDMRLPLSLSGQFSCFKMELLTRHKADRLKIAIQSAKPNKNYITRLLYEQTDDRTRQLRAEPVMFVVDKAGRIIFSSPAAFLRRSCERAFGNFKKQHDKTDAFFRYDTRCDMKLMNRNLLTHTKPCPDNAVKTIRSGYTPLPFTRCVPFLTSRDKLRLSVSRPELVPAGTGSASEKSFVIPKRYI